MGIPKDGIAVGIGKPQVRLERVWDQTVKGIACHAEKCGLDRVGKKQSVGEGIMLSKISQSHIPHDFTYMWNVKNKTNANKLEIDS